MCLSVIDRLIFPQEIPSSRTDMRLDAEESTCTRHNDTEATRSIVHFEGEATWWLVLSS